MILYKCNCEGWIDSKIKLLKKTYINQWDELIAVYLLINAFKYADAHNFSCLRYLPEKLSLVWRGVLSTPSLYSIDKRFITIFAQMKSKSAVQ